MTTLRSPGFTILAALLLAAALPTLASDAEREAHKGLTDAITANDDARVQAAAVRLAALRSADALDALLGTVRADLPPAQYWTILAAAGGFDGPDSIERIVEWIQKTGGDGEMAFDLMTLLASRNFSTASGV